MLFRYMTDIKVHKVPIWQITQFFILLMDVLLWSISPVWRLLVEANCQFGTEEGVDGVLYYNLTPLPLLSSELAVRLYYSSLLQVPVMKPATSLGFSALL